MGKNIYQSLHTSSQYLNGLYDVYGLIDSQFQVEGKISNLKAKERQLYKNFGVNTFSEFMFELKKWFNSAESKNDREALRRFSADNLQSYLRTYASNSNVLKQPVNLTFDLTNLESLNIKVKDKDMFIDGKLSVNLDFEPSTIKQELKKHFSKRFNSKNENMKTANEFIQNLISKNALKISTLTEEKKGNCSFEETVFIPNYPWGLYMEEIREIEKEGSGIRFQELLKAQMRIKDIVLKEIPGTAISSELREAMQIVWNSNFGGGTFSALAFFKGGKSGRFINAVQGSLGEFQTAVLFEYIKLKFGSISGAALTSIQGNIFSGSEQARTDVQALGEFGIQVKNLSIRSNGRIRDISTTMHPEKFANYYLDNERQDFLGFLANYFFNLTYQQSSSTTFETLESYLGERLGEVMNMTMNDLVLDTVCFYFVDGQFLIPGSAILEASNKLVNDNGLSLKQSVNIFSNYTGKTDEEFEKDSEWTNYWINNNGTWEPTSKNESEYSKLISSSISLKTNFNLSELLISSYNIFSP